MKWLLQILTVLVVGFIYNISCQQGLIFSCPGGYALHSPSCYKAFRTTANWIQAKSYCQVFGSSLVEINNQDEEIFIMDYLNRTLGDYPSTSFWVDGADILVEGDWTWVRAVAPLGYTDWSSGQPSHNGAGKNCMEVTMAQNASWSDDNCEKMQSFICEREAIVGD